MIASCESSCKQVTLDTFLSFLYGLPSSPFWVVKYFIRYNLSNSFFSCLTQVSLSLSYTFLSIPAPSPGFYATSTASRSLYRSSQHSPQAGFGPALHRVSPAPDGSVIILRNCLKDYLNLHRNTLYQNPRFTALFPRHWRLNPQAHSPVPSSTLSSCSSSIASDQSSARSYASWGGINNHHVLPQQPVPLAQPQHPDMHPYQPPPIFPNEPPAHLYPPLSPSATNLEWDSPPPTVHIVDGCKFSSLSFYHNLLPPPLPLLVYPFCYVLYCNTMESFFDTMKSLLQTL